MPAALNVLLRYPDYRRLFLAELVMFGGDWFAMIPLLMLLPELTGSGLWGGLVLTVDTGVHALILPYAGTLADRVDRRRMMLVTNLVSLVAVLALLLVRSEGTVWIALVAVAIITTGKAFYTPAAGAALPNLVDPVDLPTANALGGASWGTMLVIGASLGGVAASVAGPYPCFLIDAACMGLAALLLRGVRRPTQSQTEPGIEQEKTMTALAEALRYVRSRPSVAALVTVKPAVGFGNGVVAVFPLLAATVFRTGPLGAGLLFAARGLGSLIGPFLLRSVFARRGWLLGGAAVSMTLYGLAYLVVAVTPWFWLAVPMVVLAHLAGGANWTLSSTALQAAVPDTLRGRVLATDLMIVTLAVSFSQLGAGVLVDHVSCRVAVGGCALATLGYAAIWRLATRGAPDPGFEEPGFEDPVSPDCESGSIELSS